MLLLLLIAVLLILLVVVIILLFVFATAGFSFEILDVDCIVAVENHRGQVVGNTEEERGVGHADDSFAYVHYCFFRAFRFLVLILNGASDGEFQLHVFGTLEERAGGGLAVEQLANALFQLQDVGCATERYGIREHPPPTMK